MSTAENHRLRSTTCSANLGLRKVSIETCRSQHPFFGHGDLQDHLSACIRTGIKTSGVLAKQ